MGSRHSLCREPGAGVLGKETWPRKNSRRPCAECYTRQRRCRVLEALCREFAALGKAWISYSDVRPVSNPCRLGDEAKLPISLRLLLASWYKAHSWKLRRTVAMARKLISHVYAQKQQNWPSTMHARMTSW
jgi:hypothetical protein